ncbi:MAG: hypothetical protein PHW43_05205, partial [Syntrophales bacterium]|nr:hypothetical protein [Syntrophales bacterium]
MKLPDVQPRVIRLGGCFQAFFPVPVQDGSGKRSYQLPVGPAEQIADRFLPDPGSRLGNYLVEDALRIPHAPLGCFGDP